MRMVQGVLTERSGLKVKVMTEAAAAHFANGISRRPESTVNCFSRRYIQDLLIL